MIEALLETPEPGRKWDERTSTTLVDILSQSTGMFVFSYLLTTRSRCGVNILWLGHTPDKSSVKSVVVVVVIILQYVKLLCELNKPMYASINSAKKCFAILACRQAKFYTGRRRLVAFEGHGERAPVVY